MKASTTLLALAAALAPAFAVPAPEAAPEAAAEPAELENRDANSVYVCSGQNWSGQCTTYYMPYNQCQPWSALGLSGLGSWGPSQGTYCIWYNKPCGDGSAVGSDTFTYPGFSSVPGYWMYNTQSWKCWW